jgi:ribosomal protein S8E
MSHLRERPPLTCPLPLSLRRAEKRQFEMARQASNTRIGPKRIHTVRVRGGNIKHRALRLER